MDVVDAFLLDFLPFTDELYSLNPVFAHILQDVALQLLFTLEPKQQVRVLERMLQLTEQLGYLDAEVVQYLQRGLLSIATKK